MGYKKIIPKHPGANSSNMTMVGIGVDDPTTNLDVLGDLKNLATLVSEQILPAVLYMLIHLPPGRHWLLKVLITEWYFKLTAVMLT